MNGDFESQISEIKCALDILESVTGKRPVYADNALGIITVLHDRICAEALQEAAERGKVEWFRNFSTVTWARMERAILGTDA